MKTILLAALVSVFSAHADVVKIDKLGQEWMLYIDDGRILYLNDKQKDEYLGREKFREIKNLEDFVPETLDEPAYEPTVMSTMDEVRSVFSKLFRNMKDNSICANRAELWTYEMWRKKQIKSMKAFLFFTHKYNRTYRHEWWYHVTPYVLAKTSPTTIDEMTLDRQYMAQPLQMELWVKAFMNNRFTCPTIQKYEEYEKGQETGWCYVRKVPMYTWMPANIAESDKTGVFPGEFSQSQVYSALHEAVKRRYRDDYIRRVD